MNNTSSPNVDDTLRAVVRRYRLTPSTMASAQAQHPSPSTSLAITIEQTRETLARGKVPNDTLQHAFITALALLIEDAMRPDGEDPAFLMMLLKHRFDSVEKYASLSPTAKDDHRTIRRMADTLAHPGKLRWMAPGPRLDALSDLHRCASSATWDALDNSVLRLLDMPDVVADASLSEDLRALLGSEALQRLRDIKMLASDKHVLEYEAMRDQHSPAAKSATAVSQGAISQQRGAAVEWLAAQAFGALAERLNALEKGQSTYRVVTSMRVPASMPGHPNRAKGEWDVVLLKRVDAEQADAWDICLLLEAKASIDAATTDFPRLLRGLRCLARAEEDAVYAFETGQGTVRLRGASLSALPADATSLAQTVLYCSDAPAEGPPRLLNAASRMQLLSAHASLDYASALAQRRDENGCDLEAVSHDKALRGLKAVWLDVLHEPRWHAVLNQYRTLSTVRELMVHPDDLMAVINRQATADAPSIQASVLHARYQPEIAPDTAKASWP